jgi:hypothetical protein
MTAIPLMSLPILAGALIGLRHGRRRGRPSPAPSPECCRRDWRRRCTLALHGRFTAVRGDLVHDLDRADHGDRRAGRIEC